MTHSHENAFAKVVHSALAGAVTLIAMRLLVNYGADGGPEFFDRLNQICRFSIAAAISLGIVGYSAQAAAFFSAKRQDRQR